MDSRSIPLGQQVSIEEGRARCREAGRLVVALSNSITSWSCDVFDRTRSTLSSQSFIN